MRGEKERGIGAERENTVVVVYVVAVPACMASMHILGCVQGPFDGAAGGVAGGVPVLERFASLSTCVSNER